MKCPKCGEDMEYEEIKWPSGEWFCDCGATYYGEKFACDADALGNITDHEERIGEETSEPT